MVGLFTGVRGRAILRTSLKQRSEKFFVDRSSIVYEIVLSGYEEAHGVRMGSKKGQAGTVYCIVARSALGDGYDSSFDGMHVQSAEGGRSSRERSKTR
jgi:hypothetical protein